MWASRIDARGTTTFISSSATGVQLLLPPGAALAHGEPAGGEGLWIQASWTRDAEPLVELDAPDYAWRLPTAEAVFLLGPAWADEAERLVTNQLRHAWSLCEPGTDGRLEDRRAHAHAALLMALSAEMRTAFPASVEPANPASAWSPDTADFERLLDDREPDVDLDPWRVVRALLRLLWRRLRHGVPISLSALIAAVRMPSPPVPVVGGDPPPPSREPTRGAPLTR